jgi:hypothetical protein
MTRSTRSTRSKRQVIAEDETATAAEVPTMIDNGAERMPLEEVPANIEEITQNLEIITITEPVKPQGKGKKGKKGCNTKKKAANKAKDEAGAAEISHVETMAKEISETCEILMGGVEGEPF